MTTKRSQREDEQGMADLFDLPILPHPSEASRSAETISPAPPR